MMMVSNASAPALSRLGSSCSNLVTMAIGSLVCLVPDMKSTGFRPDQPDKAVRLEASGWRPFDIRDRVVCDTPVCSLTAFQLAFRARTVALSAL